MIWLIGVGNMGKEYAKILDALNVEYLAIGRSEKSSADFESVTGHSAIRGGLDEFLKTKPQVVTHAIVAVGVSELASTTEQLLAYGVKQILLEKPGVAYIYEIDSLVEKAESAHANVLLAYNRRFYSSVLKAEEIIAQDGGVSSFNFEFTEWAHQFSLNTHNTVNLNNLLFNNSSHVIDTAFFLGGNPVKLSTYIGGQGAIDWHLSGSIYAGAGVSDRGALFSYQANWGAPGRWVVEILTSKHRLYFKPMESLQIQEKGSVAVDQVEVDNSLDTQYKPGLYLQTKAFLDGNFTRFCTIGQQKDHIDKFYRPISGYDK